MNISLLAEFNREAAAKAAVAIPLRLPGLRHATPINWCCIARNEIKKEIKLSKDFNG
jgi:hypothetical protein